MSKGWVILVLGTLGGAATAQGEWRFGNQVSFLRQGPEFFPRRLELMKHARRSIDVSTFLLCDGEGGDAIVSELIAAQKPERGVKVRVVVDGFNVMPHKKVYARLREAHVPFVTYNAPLKTGSFNDRLHAKVTVIDGEVALVGGANLCDEYLLDRPEVPVWNDFELEVRGPVVADVQEGFERTWLWGLGKREETRRRVPRRPDHPALPEEGATEDAAEYFYQHEGSEPQAGTRVAEAFARFIDGARERVVIYKPYLLFNHLVFKALLRAGARGVKLSLFTNSMESNHLPDRTEVWAAWTYYPELYQAGAEIYESAVRTHHGKAFLVDRTWLGVGSHDMTPRAARTNVETMLWVRSPEAIARFEAAVGLDRAEYHPVDEQEFRRRVGSHWGLIKLKLARWTRWLY